MEREYTGGFDIAEVEQESFVIYDANIIKLTVGTTGPQGGDAGHGGVTKFKLEDEGGTYLVANVVDTWGQDISIVGPKSVEIMVRGDAEMRTLIDSLELAARTLRRIAGYYNEGISYEKVEQTTA